MTALFALIGLKIFLSLVVLIAIRKFKRLFLHSHGWSHRLVGGAHLLWLFLGAFSIIATSKEPEETLRSRVFCYDIILGILGVTATLTGNKLAFLFITFNPYPHILFYKLLFWQLLEIFLTSWYQTWTDNPVLFIAKQLSLRKKWLNTLFINF